MVGKEDNTPGVKYGSEQTSSSVTILMNSREGTYGIIIQPTETPGSGTCVVSGEPVTRPAKTRNDQIRPGGCGRIW